MTNIRRYDPFNHPVFMTAVCYQRHPFLKEDTDKKLLLSVMRAVKNEKPYRMIGYVILDDHFHWMIRLEKLPQRSGKVTPIPTREKVGEYDISKLMQSVKLRFTYQYKKRHGVCDNLKVWQRRFWDHIARDQEDICRHMDYMHYNPVKHDYASDPLDYRFSSFQAYVERGAYKSGWGKTGAPANMENTAWE